MSRQLLKHIILLLPALACCWQVNGQLPFQHKPAHYWIDCRTTQEIYDDQVLQLMGNTAAFITLHTKTIDADDSFSLKNIIKRARRVAPNLPLLMYSWTTIGDSAASDYSAPTNEYLPLNFLSAQPPSPNYLGEPLVTFGGSTFYDVTGKVLGDVTKTAFMRWIEPRIVDTMRSYLFDGIMNDNFHPSPYIVMPTQCPAGRSSTNSFCGKYYDSVIKLVTDIKDSIGSAKFVFNGLNSHSNFGADTEQLHAAALGNGATVEYFGYAYYSHDSDAMDQTIPFIRQMSEHPTTHVFVCGKGVSAPYVGYVDDLTWERYVFASYLLGKNDSSTFHYFVDYALPHPYGGRSTPLDYYDDMQAVDLLGAPVDTYKINTGTGIYYRVFSGGIVYVYPYTASSGTGVVNITTATYTMDSTRPVTASTLTLTKGHALIMLNSPIDSVHHVITKNFDDASEPTKTWEYCKNLVSGSHHYDSLWAPPSGYAHLHDLMLDWNRSDSNWHSMQFQVRGAGDNTAGFYIVADVEDNSKHYMQVVLYDSLCNVSIPSTHFYMGATPLFRQAVASSGAIDSTNTYFIPMSTRINQSWSAGWQTVVVNADQILIDAGLTGFTIKRLGFMRLTGSLDISNIVMPAPGIGHRETSTPVYNMPITWQIYPNPTRDEVQVTVNTNADESITFKLVDINGRLLKTTSATINGTRTIKINVADFPAGNYVLSLIKNDKVYESKQLQLVK